MANSLEFVDWLTAEALRQLVNPLEVAQFFNTDYTPEYKKEFTVGDSVRIPFPNRFFTTTGLGYQPQPIIDRHATAVMDRTLGIHFEWDSIEAALKMPRSEERISKKILKPMMAQLAQDLDSQCAQFAYLNTPNVVGTLGTDPSTFDDIFGAADQRFTELGCPAGVEKGMILWPKQYRALRKSAVSYFNPASQISSMFKTGSVGTVNGVDSYQSMSLYSHTAGTWAGAVTVTTTSVSGATTLAVTCTNGDTFNAGDVFSVGSVYEVNPSTRRTTGTLKQFVVAVSTTGATSAATLQLVYSSSQGAIIGPGNPYQNVDALPLSGAALTLFPGTSSPNGKSGVNSLALTDMAFGLVSVPLANPKSSAADMVSTQTDPKTGIKLSFLRMFDPIQRRWINRFDCLFGLFNLYNDVGAIRALGA